MVSKILLLSAVIVVVLVAAIYIPAPAQSSSASSSSSTATTTSSCTTSDSTTTSTSTSSATSNVIYGQFSYTQASSVKIVSVEATAAEDSYGNTTVAFQVLFENVGVAPIYVLGGCGGGLSATIVGSSSVLRQVSGGSLCDCAAIILTLVQGQNHTSVTPGCWSGYAYHLLSPGSVTMNMTLQWSTNGQSLEGTNSTSIQAEFAFS